MKFTLAAASTFFTAALAATLPKSFTLVADGGNTVLTDNTHAIVDFTQANTLKILRLNSQDGATITFTQEGAPPTAWQNLFAIEGKSEPLGLTTPHSGATPTGAVLNAWGITEDGYLTFQGQNSFGLSADKKQVYFLGNDSSIPKVTLWVKNLN
ncbi:hypothetical protein BDV27DRAFT_123092 [Aspergillus caelatus]|uniref:Uncharacterized protein n=2 Tax=Aspergillus subgen. Circumdati TaxID=2720871 RepID=A0A5N7ADR0_9EURO|nr:uncharacterized protein BDV27DRAFT_123092 [Aspergillus caelatus]KAE8368001.1 hypothetical protein BDV27DRAFT_123092 [Aspergillus caelatus]KAE8413747.1 hypothetical protein BDV36DRAFT_23719 [Aspergillus pseudocaelatus]